MKKTLFLLLFTLSLTTHGYIVEKILRVYRTRANGGIQFHIVISSGVNDTLMDDAECECIFAQKIVCDFHANQVQCTETNILKTT